jgi:hypothetical protein
MPYKDPKVKKAKNKEYSRKHYEKNREKTKLTTKTAKIREKAKWYIYKSALSCQSCGFKHVAAMDFHHVDPSTKEDNVWRLISNGQYAKAYEEIKKCVVLCANCHRIHHHKERLKNKNPAL